MKYYNILNEVKGKQTAIPIVLSANNDSAPFMYTTMISILESGFQNTYYIFYLLVSFDFSKYYENIILEINNKYRCNIYFIHIKKEYEKKSMKKHHLYLTNIYQLLIANLLPKEIDKCIYLDLDICVNKDLSNLFNINLQNNYIAAVLSPIYYIEDEIHFKRFNISSIKQYVNTGVLLMNLKLIRFDNLTEKLIELSNNNYDYKVQDILNIACYGKILTLPPKYNTMVRSLKEKKSFLKVIFKEEDIIEANKSPYIIHYIGKKKPWNSIGFYMEKYWWDIAKKTPFVKIKFNRENIFKSELKKIWFKKKKKH